MGTGRMAFKALQYTSLKLYRVKGNQILKIK